MHELDAGHTKGITFVFTQLKLWARLLFLTPRSAGMYIWFADYFSVIPLLISRMFNKKSFLVIGGFDAAKKPELNHGAHIKPFRSFCVKTSCSLATQILPVSKFTEEELFRNTNKDYTDKSQVIYNGTYTNKFKPGKLTKEDTIVTICGAQEEKVLKIKSVDFYLQIAETLPHYQFLIIGPKGKALEKLQNRPKNVTVIPYCSQEELITYLQEAKVICQFSRYESFGLALIEGMLCECVPVGYRYGGTKEIINKNIGYLIENLNVTEGAVAIKKAIVSTDKGTKAREYVINNFSIEKRQAAIIEMIDQTINKN